MAFFFTRCSSSREQLKKAFIKNVIRRKLKIKKHYFHDTAKFRPKNLLMVPPKLRQYVVGFCHRAEQKGSKNSNYTLAKGQVSYKKAAGIPC